MKKGHQSFRGRKRRNQWRNKKFCAENGWKCGENDRKYDDFGLMTKKRSSEFLRDEMKFFWEFRWKSRKGNLRVEMCSHEYFLKHALYIHTYTIHKQAFTRARKLHMHVKCWTCLRRCLVSRQRGFGLIRGDIGSPVCSQRCWVFWGYRAGPHSFCGLFSSRISSLVALRWWPAPRTVLSEDRCSPRRPPDSPDLYPESIFHYPLTANRRRVRTYVLKNTFVVSSLLITEACVNVGKLKYYHESPVGQLLTLPEGSLFVFSHSTEIQAMWL